jgi:type II secretory pathway component PulF
MGIIGDIRGETIDILGWGLVGPKGLAIYVGFVAGVAAVFGVVVSCIRRGMVWTRPVQRLVMRVPKIGRILETLALARFAWSLSLTLDAGVEVRRAMKLALRSTRNARFIDRIEAVDGELSLGHSIHDALRAGVVFPIDFLDALAVGEESGNLVESMAHLSRAYHEQARAALGVLNTLLGVVVWLIVAAFIIAMIFRLFGFYLGVLNDAMG